MPVGQAWTSWSVAFWCVAHAPPDGVRPPSHIHHDRKVIHVMRKMSVTQYWAGIRAEQERRRPERPVFAGHPGSVTHLPPVRRAPFSGTAGL